MQKNGSELWKTGEWETTKRNGKKEKEVCLNEKKFRELCDDVDTSALT